MTRIYKLTRLIVKREEIYKVFTNYELTYIYVMCDQIWNIEIKGYFIREFH